MSLQLLVVYGIFYFFLAVFMLEFFRYRLAGMGYTWRFTMVIAVFVGLCGGLTVSQYRDGRAVFTAFLGGSYIMLGDMTAKILLSVDVVPAVVFVTEVICHVTLLFLLVRYLLPSYRDLQQVYRVEWGRFAMVLIMFYGSVYLLFDCLKRPDATVVHYMMPLAYLFTIYLLIVLMFQMLRRLKMKELENREQKVLEACMEALKMEVGYLRQAERQVAEYNHDSRHFVRMLRGMMAEKDYQGVDQTLAEMRDMPDMTNRNRYCRNIPLNGVVTHYARLAKSQQIQMTVELETLPEDLGGNGWEIAMVLGNILENAVRVGRRLYIGGRQNKNHMLFEVRSVFSETVKLDDAVKLSFLDSKEGRGLGMRSLAGLVQQWNGTLDCGVDGECFYVKILI